MIGIVDQVITYFRAILYLGRQIFSINAELNTIDVVSL